MYFFADLIKVTHLSCQFLSDLAPEIVYFAVYGPYGQAHYEERQPPGPDFFVGHAGDSFVFFQIALAYGFPQKFQYRGHCRAEPRYHLSFVEQVEGGGHICRRQGGPVSEPVLPR